jgi:hypothetical protein
VKRSSREHATPLNKFASFADIPTLQYRHQMERSSIVPARGNGGFSFSSLRNAAASFRRAAAFRRFAHFPNQIQAIEMEGDYEFQIEFRQWSNGSPAG